MNSIEVFSLTKKFENITAVDEVSLAIQPGEIFGLLGPNGAGKTTLLMMLSTLLKPTSGQAFINGYDVAKEPAKVRQSLGMVFQDPSSDELLTAYENLKLHALMYDVPLRKIESRIEDVLSIVDLNHRKHDQVKKFSGGMRRRMEIARGLIHWPKVVFLDEPTLGLDPQTREHIWEYIENLSRQEKTTVVLTTHYMEEAQRLCQKIAIIDKGKIIANDRTENLRRALEGDTVILHGENILIDRLRKLPFVKSLQPQEHKVLLRVENSDQHLQEILTLSGPIKSVELHTADLNDVFLYYTGTGLREGHGGTLEHLRSIERARHP